MTGARVLTPRFDETGVDILFDGLVLARYVFRPDPRHVHAPKPYLAPVRSLAGEDVTVVRPHDHPWHNGVQLALPYAGDCNLWGGPTYVAGRGYVDRRDNGRMRHLAFERILSAGPRVDMVEQLSWLGPSEDLIADETRTLTFDTRRAAEGVWRIGLDSRAINRTPRPLRFSSPAVEGRAEAGYGGWVWRGPRSFTGGRVVGPFDLSEPMSVRSPWLAFSGRHDGSGETTTIVMRPRRGSPPPRWFVRRDPYAIMGPAPFYDAPTHLEPGETLRLGCDIHIATGKLSAPAIQALLADAPEVGARETGEQESATDAGVSP